ncbi:MAG: hypothetical protein GY754_25410 [bacterium]|nr:hypothetical protein [bacterium]
MRSIKPVFTILIILLAVGPSLYAKGGKTVKSRIAVMEFKATGVSAGTASKVSELVRIEVVNTGKYILLERSQMDKILKEQGLQQALCTDEDCAVEVGRLLSTKKILIGTAMQLGSVMILTARIVDIEQASVERAAKVSVKDESGISRAVGRLVEELTGLKPKKKTIKKITKVVDKKNPPMDMDTGGGLDMSDMNLERANLSEQDLTRANLAGVNLAKAKLRNSILIKANMKEANLKKAVLIGANLEGANMARTNLDRAVLKEAVLEGAYLQGANMYRTNLKNADLKNADLRGANLEGAILVGADLEGANFEKADLKKARVNKKWRMFLLKQKPLNYNRIIWR